MKRTTAAPPLKILLGCEFTGRVREAFRKRGFNAVSCDINLPTVLPGPHYQEDVFVVIKRFRPDVLIAFPPCTHLTSSGARWWAEKRRLGLQQDALRFVERLMNARVPHIAIENPVGCISTYIREPEQIIQPYMFGHPELKTTCLWLDNLPLLKATRDVKDECMARPIKERKRIHHMSGWSRRGDDNQRALERSKTYPGIARAMAKQWGDYVNANR
jgi:hypothetical protein